MKTWSFPHENIVIPIELLLLSLLLFVLYFPQQFIDFMDNSDWYTTMVIVLSWNRNFWGIPSICFNA